jgi:serine/threonine-protein kinase
MMAELAGVMVGNYFLLECIAREGLVEMYRARPTTRGGYDVVLRLFRPHFPDPSAFREHFAAEVEKVWHCHHPHIMPLLEFGTGHDLLYTVTLIPDTITLEEFLETQQERLLPIDLVVRLITQLCSAVQYAHEQNIVHGNIQLTSIFVRDNADVQLTNFSMRHAYQIGEPLAAQLDEGNPLYAAPEQGLGMVCPASDIYSLGVLLYQLLCGTLPYNGASADDIMLKHANEPIPSLRALRPNVSEAMELVVRVALAKTPEARFPSAQALAQALLAAVTYDSPPVPPMVTTPLRHIHVRSKRTFFTWSRAVSLFTLALLLFGLLSAAFFVFSLSRLTYDIRNHPFWDGGLVPYTTPVQETLLVVK